MISKQNFLRWLVLIGVFSLGLSLGGIIFSYLLDSRLTQVKRYQAFTQVRNSHGSANPVGSFQPAAQFETAADKSVQSVVYIQTVIGRHAEGLLDFHAFLGPEETASGSGVIISDEGYIITNNHVVENARSVRVSLNDKSEYEAEVIATDPNTDLAVVKVNAKNLPTLQFENSDNVHIGDWVLAVGNPFDLTGTVTAGIISAKARNVGILHNHIAQNSTDYAIESFLQTDAVVNPGNSGGALVNLNGDLVGIITAIATGTGTFEGYSFAIPANLVRKVVADMIAYGQVQRGFLGVSIQDVNYKLAHEKSLTTNRGAFVSGLSGNGAAKEAGLKTGDVITAVNQKTVNSASELQEQIAGYKPGDKVAISILRGADALQLALVLRNVKGTTEILRGKHPVAETEEKATEEEFADRLLERLGATFAVPQPLELEKLNLKSGLEVAAIAKGSLVAKAGIPEGFIITRVEDTPVASEDDLLSALNGAENAANIEGFTQKGKKAVYTLKLNP